MEEMQQPIAKVEGQIVAYALASSKASCLETKLLKSVVELADALEFKGSSLKDQRYYVMGQICIGQDSRGLGIFDALYHMHREKFASRYDCIVTEISHMNLRSLAAHRRVGFEVIHHYFDGETHWQMVAWDWK